MKILFFHRWTGVHGGGTETHLKELAKRLAKRGHQVMILTREGKKVNGSSRRGDLTTGRFKVITVSRNLFESEHSYEDWRVFWHTALFMLKSFWKLLSIISSPKTKPDIISVHFATESVVARLARFFYRVPIIFILEGYTPWEAKEARKANHSIAISHYEANRCQREFGFRPQVIPIGIDFKRFSPSGPKSSLINLEKSEKAILTVCRLEPRKDLKTLLEAARLAQKDSLPFQFFLAGEGIDGEKLKSASWRKKLQNFHFLGFVKDEELPSLYRAADVFVLPTFEEGFGIVLVEAMASGMPVISNPVGAVPEVLKDAGILVPNKNPGTLLRAIKKVLTNQSLRQKIIKRGLRRAKALSWEKIIEEYEKAYQKALLNC